MTDEERILEFAGWRKFLIDEDGNSSADGEWYGCYEDDFRDIYDELPTLDMNFYFRYVVPKIESITIFRTEDGKYEFCLFFPNDEGFNVGVADTPEQAFKEALLKYLDLIQNGIDM